MPNVALITSVAVAVPFIYAYYLLSLKPKFANYLIKIGLYKYYNSHLLIEKIYTFAGAHKYEKIKSTLHKNFPYYQRLTETDKQKFIHRVLAFEAHRTFNFVGNSFNQKKEISYFVSAIAVQLTFGLNKYLLSHFREIYITQTSYPSATNDLYQGHVEEGKIFLSWDNTYYGVKNETDKHNLALHEFAHALTYECFQVGNAGDEHFRNNFSKFTRAAHPYFEKAQIGQHNFLGTYAATNLHEYWAVSIEAFFEQKQQMQTSMPEVYQVLCFLLNQN